MPTAHPFRFLDYFTLYNFISTESFRHFLRNPFVTVDDVHADNSSASTFSFRIPSTFHLLLLPGIQNVDHSAGSVRLTTPRGGRDGKRWGRGAKLEFLSSAQRERAPRCHIFRDEIENVSLLTGSRLWIYWHSPEEEHSAQNTANGRQTSVSQIFNIEQKLKQQNMKLGHKSSK